MLILHILKYILIIAFLLFLLSWVASSSFWCPSAFLFPQFTCDHDSFLNCLINAILFLPVLFVYHYLAYLNLKLFLKIRYQGKWKEINMMFILIFLKWRLIFQVIFKFTSQYYCNCYMSVFMIISSKAQFHKMWDFSVTYPSTKRRDLAWELLSPDWIIIIHIFKFFFSHLCPPLFFLWYVCKG